eukprot:UN09609
MSDSHKGKRHTNETKEKIRQKKLGQRLSPEIIEKMKEGHRNISAETKLKMRLAKLGKKRGPNKKRT